MILHEFNTRGPRIWFAYKLYNEKNELVNEAETELAFVQKNNWKPCVAPDFVLKAVEQTYNQVTEPM